MWFFEELDKRGRWKRLSWRMTDEDAARHMQRNDVELRKVEITAEVPEDPLREHIRREGSAVEGLAFPPAMRL